MSEADTELEPRSGATIETAFGSYDMQLWSGRNESGIRALCDKVLVLPDQSVTMTDGGIIIPDVVKETVGMAATTGILVSAGPQAFAYDSLRQTHWVGERPGPGTRVFFKKYAGQEHSGRDGLMYRLMFDGDIAGMEEPYEEIVIPNQE